VGVNRWHDPMLICQAGGRRFVSSYRVIIHPGSGADGDGRRRDGHGSVAEELEEGANISEVLRRNGVYSGLLTYWRQKVQDGHRRRFMAQGFICAIREIACEAAGTCEDGRAGRLDSPGQTVRPQIGIASRQAWRGGRIG